MAEPSLTEHVAPIDAGAHVVAATFLADTPALALADGTALLGPRRVTLHADAGILVAAADGKRMVTGGDDGRVIALGPDGSTHAIADEKGKWIDALALRGDGAVAWAMTKTVRACNAKGEVKSWAAPSSARGLAFFPKGYRLAVAHYNGVSQWFPNAAAAPDALDWKGSHLDVTVSADGRFCVSSMQENALHGWRLADKKNMRMSGYPAKSRSMSWSHDGHWLATSGAEACIAWPFQTKEGPMGQPPRECGVRPAKVTRVAFHPKALVVALGYEDGWIMLCRFTDASELLVRRRPEGEFKDPVTALAWDATGARLLFGTDGGKAGLLTLPS